MRPIEFTEEDALLLDSARSFAEKHGDFGRLRETMATPSGHDPALYATMAELGWLGLAAPVEHGGSGLAAGRLVPLVEMLGRRLMAGPLLANTLAVHALTLAGDSATRDSWLSQLSDGSAIATFAACEPHGSWDPLCVTSVAKPGDGGYALSGIKSLVLDAQNADLVVAPVKLGDTLALALVETKRLATGTVKPEILQDEARRSARIDLAGVSLDEASVLKGPGIETAVRQTHQLGALLLSAECVGCAHGAFELTLDYLRTRKQFGRLIGGYQSLKHTMVDVLVELEHGRSLLYRAATVFDGDDRDRAIAVHMAKAQASDTCCFAADRAVQFHGGMGFTHECNAQLFFRRAQWANYAFGDAAHHRRALEPLLLD